MFGFIRFCWRAFESSPVTAIGGAAMTYAGVDYQQWLAWVANHPPPILASKAIQLVIVATGVFLIAYVFYRQSERERNVGPRPDWDVADAIHHLRVRSKWAIGRIYYDAKIGRLIEQDIDEALRDAAAQERISIWGRPAQTGAAALFGRGIEIKVPIDDLQNMSIDLTTMDDSEAPRGAVLRAHSQDQYCFLRVNRGEICSEWPAASYVKLFFDKAWKGRRLRTIPDDGQSR